MIYFEYHQSNSNYTIFLKKKGKIIAPIVYVNNIMVITDD